MNKFKVDDVVVRLPEFRGFLGWECGDEPMRVARCLQCPEIGAPIIWLERIGRPTEPPLLAATWIAERFDLYRPELDAVP